MVSLRCITVVKSILDKLGYKYKSVTLGEVELHDELSHVDWSKLDVILRKSGFQLMDDKRAIMVEKIKQIIIEMIHYSDDAQLKTNFSDHLTQHIDQPYDNLSRLFVEVKGTTIEHFIQLHKIERVKELIIYDEMNLTAIAYKMHYSSVQHLSTQFKKITGLTPSDFKNLKIKRRTMLEDL